MTTESGKADPRILILSQRGCNRKVYQTMAYEFEDVISTIDDAAILSPALRSQNRLLGLVRRPYSQVRRALKLHPEADIDAIKLDRDYEMFFCVMSFPSQLPLLKKIRNLRQRCRKAVCFLLEIWSDMLPRDKRHLSILEDLGFDFVFFPHPGPLPRLQTSLATRCEFLPCGVDCVQFCPVPKTPVRSIDCLSIGRRSRGTHAGLLALAATGDFHYMYDTMANFDVVRYREHRALLANLIKRSRYFIAYTPSAIDPTHCGDDIISARFFEGAAGGAAMLGAAPTCKEFRELFDWPHAVIPVPADCANIGDIIADWDAKPERLAALRRNSVVSSLARHDWAYRWQQILSVVGMQPRDALRQRIARLQELKLSAQAAP